MTADEAFEILLVEKEFIQKAGPAVLRLKLMEIGSLCQRRLVGDEVVVAARTAAQELRRLIAERPCVSLIDFKARDKVLHPAGSRRQRSAKTSGWIAELASPLFPERSSKETAGQPHAYRGGDSRRSADDAEFDQRDGISPDSVSDQGNSLRGLREYSFLMNGIFDSTSEPTRFITRANEPVNRCAPTLLRGDAKSEQGANPILPIYKKSA